MLQPPSPKLARGAWWLESKLSEFGTDLAHGRVIGLAVLGCYPGDVRCCKYLNEASRHNMHCSINVQQYDSADINCEFVVARRQVRDTDREQHRM